MAKDLAQLISESKWTEFLTELPNGKPRGFLFPSAKAMESCKAVATRMNMRGDEKFSISINYADKIITITRQ